jgi:glycosyltransferase involved in cell wall biosynthesis
MALIDQSVAVVNTSEFEGMSNIFLEAWARGVPALSLFHDPDGIVEHHGLGGFADSSRERLVDLARIFWEDLELRMRVGERCRSYVANAHSPRVLAERWAQVLTPGTDYPMANTPF